MKLTAKPLKSCAADVIALFLKKKIQNIVPIAVANFLTEYHRWPAKLYPHQDSQVPHGHNAVCGYCQATLPHGGRPDDIKEELRQLQSRLTEALQEEDFAAYALYATRLQQCIMTHLLS